MVHGDWSIVHDTVTLGRALEIVVLLWTPVTLRVLYILYREIFLTGSNHPEISPTKSERNDSTLDDPSCRVLYILYREIFMIGRNNPEISPTKSERNCSTLDDPSSSVPLNFELVDVGDEAEQDGDIGEHPPLLWQP
jgi:hypothetical protein